MSAGQRGRGGRWGATPGSTPPPRPSPPRSPPPLPHTIPVQPPPVSRLPRGQGTCVVAVGDLLPVGARGHGPGHARARPQQPARVPVPHPVLPAHTTPPHPNALARARQPRKRGSEEGGRVGGRTAGSWCRSRPPRRT
eukprot:1264897-Rhodomonas_salina.1